jgi:MFS family permease
MQLPWSTARHIVKRGLFFGDMLKVLAHPDYARLFAAQVIALTGTGLLTVGLGLLAYDLAADRAGAVLGTAFAIKMVAYVGLAPVAGAVVGFVPRKAVLIGADMVRAAAALCLPFVDAVWQIYALIFVLQAASATFTPTFQAIIPDVLPVEADYTRALSLSRIAYDLESLASPALAGALLLVISYHGLFAGTVVGFACSAALVWRTRIPGAVSSTGHGFAQRLTRGMRIYLATPRCRGLLALNLTAAAAGAFVIVNTVVVVRSGYGAGEAGVAVALAAFGAGSMAVALALPRLLDRLPDRGVMMVAGAVISGLIMALSAVMAGGVPDWWVLLGFWAALGAGYSAVLTPMGRLLRRSAGAADRPALFAAQFALSHVCWLLTYPLAGALGQAWGMASALAVLAVVALAGVWAAWRVWPPEQSVIAHRHDDLPKDHPHLAEHPPRGGRHAHGFTIDDLHPVWPGRGAFPKVSAPRS